MGQVAIFKKKPQAFTPRGIPKSLLEAILEEPDRFVSGLRGNRHIRDFGTFVQELKREFAIGNGQNAVHYISNDIENELAKILFNSRTIRDTIFNNVGKEEFDKVYAKPPDLTAQQPLPQFVQPTIVTITISQYQRKGKSISGHSRGKSFKFQPAQSKFLQIRRQKGIKMSQAMSEYRNVFKQDLRSDKSIKTKFYRL